MVKLAATFEKPNQQRNSLLFARQLGFFKMSPYFYMAGYKRNVVVAIKMGAYIHGVLILYGSLLSRFYGMINSSIVTQVRIIHPNNTQTYTMSQGWRKMY